MKISKKHLDIFKAAVTKYQQELGLMNWDICVSQEELPETDWAETRADVQAHYALIVLNTLIEANLVAGDIRMTAYHEVLEVMLYPMRIALSKLFAWDVVDEMIHDVIQRLINSKKI